MTKKHFKAFRQKAQLIFDLCKKQDPSFESWNLSKEEVDITEALIVALDALDDTVVDDILALCKYTESLEKQIKELKKAVEIIAISSVKKKTIKKSIKKVSNRKILRRRDFFKQKLRNRKKK